MNREKVAVKVVSDVRHFEAAVHESNISKDLNHANVIKTRACFKTQSQTVMTVQEYAEQGDLFNFIAPSTGMDEMMIRNVFPQMVEGLAYLHSLNLVHRDMKPENVVVDGNDVAKLCDFGMMGEHGKRAIHGSGTTPYMSPELHLCKGNIITNKAHDIWALGVSLYVLLTGDFPWLKAVNSDVEYAAFSSGRLTGSWTKFSSQLITLFRRMFAPIETRCTIEDVRASLDIDFFASSSSCSSLSLDSSMMSVEDEGTQVTTPTLNGRDVCGMWSSGMSNGSIDVSVKIAARELHVVALDVCEMLKEVEHVQVASSVSIDMPAMRVCVATKC